MASARHVERISLYKKLCIRSYIEWHIKRQNHQSVQIRSSKCPVVKSISSLKPFHWTLTRKCYSFTLPEITINKCHIVNMQRYIAHIDVIVFMVYSILSSCLKVKPGMLHQLIGCIAIHQKQPNSTISVEQWLRKTFKLWWNFQCFVPDIKLKSTEVSCWTFGKYCQSPACIAYFVFTGSWATWNDRIWK